jgi:uncharacterized damage-inducible protein DinB
MFTRELMLELFRHMEWADARVWTSLTASAADDDRLRTLLVHVHTVQRAFLAVWRGLPPEGGFRSPESFASLADVRAWAQPVYAEQRDFLSSGDADLTRVLCPPWVAQVEQVLGRRAGPTTLGETAFQVASHTTHHRGQINTRLRELGVEPPYVDYIVWLWLDRPAAEWSV